MGRILSLISWYGTDYISTQLRKDVTEKDKSASFQELRRWLLNIAIPSQNPELIRIGIRYSVRVRTIDY